MNPAGTSALNAMKQKGELDQLEYEEMSRTPGSGMFRYRCRCSFCSGIQISIGIIGHYQSVGRGTTKKDARASAATMMLGRLRRARE
jgi:hypothetical protein